MQPPPAKSPRITCPKCAGQNPELARFCNRCGADLTAPTPPGAATPPGSPSTSAAPRPPPPPAPAPPPPSSPSAAHPPAADPPPPPGSRSCPACHTPNPAVARFCQHCGADLTRPASPPSPAASTSPTGRKICPGCHAFNPATAGFCAECGVALPKDAATPTFGGPAGFWIRLVASAIDLILLAIITAFLMDQLDLRPPPHFAAPRSDRELQDLLRNLLHWVPVVILFVAVTTTYKMLLVGTWGGTLGKLVLGLRVVRFSDGGRVPYGLALGRGLAQLISFSALFLGHFWIALTPSKRGWHDYLCDTRVVRSRPE